jgi:hypothetical protein
MAMASASTAPRGRPTVRVLPTIIIVVLLHARVSLRHGARLLLPYPSDFSFVIAANALAFSAICAMSARRIFSLASAASAKLSATT